MDWPLCQYPGVMIPSTAARAVFVFASLVALFCLIPPTALADRKPLTEKEITKILYEDFKSVESFVFIHVRIEGEASRIGLTQERLTDLVKLRFKNNFAKIPFKDESTQLVQIYNNPEKSAKTGMLRCHVWAVGNSDYPIAYHIECQAGTFTRNDFWTHAKLGFGSAENVPETVRKALGDMIERLAVDFFTARGEL